MVSCSGDQEKLWDDQCSNRSLGPSVFLRELDLERLRKLRQWWARWWRCSPDCWSQQKQLTSKYVDSAGQILLQKKGKSRPVHTRRLLFREIALPIVNRTHLSLFPVGLRNLQCAHWRSCFELKLQFASGYCEHNLQSSKISLLSQQPLYLNSPHCKLHVHAHLCSTRAGP